MTGKHQFRDVTVEAKEIEQGLWFPARIEEVNSQLHARSTIILKELDSNPNLPPDIFDPVIALGLPDRSRLLHRDIKGRFQHYTIIGTKRIPAALLREMEDVLSTSPASLARLVEQVDESPPPATAQASVTVTEGTSSLGFVASEPHPRRGTIRIILSLIVPALILASLAVFFRWFRRGKEVTPPNPPEFN